MISSPEPTRLFNRNFLLLWQGRFVSRLGSRAYSIAVIFWLKHATGSASIMGLLLMTSMLPAVILGPVGGAIADRYSRRKIIIISDLVNGAAILALAVYIFISPGSTGIIITLLFIVSVVTGVVSSFFGPAISASIPDLVPRERLNSANSMNRASVQISGFFGHGLGGVLFRILGAPVLFLVDAVTYLFSAVTEMFIHIPQKKVEAPAGLKRAVKEFLADTVEGLKYLFGIEGSRNLILIRALMSLFSAPILILFPFYVEDHLGARPDWYGFLVAASGAGALAGYLIAGTVRVPRNRRATLMLILILINATMILSLALTTTPLYSLIMMFVAGIASGMIGVQIVTVLQLRIPSEMRGRVFGLLGTVAGSLMPIGMGLGGIIADMTGQNIPLIYLVCGSVLGVLSLILGTNRSFRKLVGYQPEDEEGDEESGSVSEGRNEELYPNRSE